MTKTLLISLLLVIFTRGYCQTVYLVTEGKEIYRLNVDNSLEFVVKIDYVRTTIFDIAISPSGVFYGITADANIIEIDIENGNTTVISPDLPNTRSYTALVCSADNELYTLSDTNELYQYNIDTDILTLVGNVGFATPGDLTLFRGNLLFKDTGSQFIKAYNIDNKSVVDVFCVPDSGVDDFWGLTNSHHSCQTATIIGTMANSLYVLNFVTGKTVDLKTDLRGMVIFGLASDNEHLSSNCDFQFEEVDCNAQDVCSNTNLTENLTAYFPFNGAANEATGTGFDGTINGAVLTTDKQLNPNSAYLFDGRDDFIHVGDHFDLGLSNFSISCKVNVSEFKDLIPGTNSRGGWIVNKGATIFGTPRRAGYALDARKIDNDNYFYFFVGDDNDNLYNANGFGFEQDRWYSLIGIKEDDSIKLYVDNQLISKSKIPTGINVDTNIPLVIGSIDKLGNDAAGTTYFDGIIDDVRIYTKALTFEERDCIGSPACSKPVVDLGEDGTLCTQSVVLDATTSDATYIWQNGSRSSKFEATESGSFWVDVSNSCGTTRGTIEIIFEDLLEVDLGEDRVICEERAIILDAKNHGATYKWQDGSNDRTFVVAKSGSYWVEIENICGIAMDSIKLSFPGIEGINIPNVFTPNGDGINDYFEIDESLLGSSIQIFQRTGKLVYNSGNYQNDWMGDNLPAGSYFYSVTDACGADYKGKIMILY